ncbi:MAG: flagellar biosynthetic protein FliO [Vampirovibrio sp.]|nr:flagellar biosynthetic protein FliO [Vampirovibrio sp.]
MTLSHLLIQFCVYTLLCIGLLYLVYFYLKRHPKLLNQAIQLSLPMTGGKKNLPSHQTLIVESSLCLEVRKNLYVLKTGHERFLIATSPEGTTCLSKLTDANEGVPDTLAKHAASMTNPHSRETSQPET